MNLVKYEEVEFLFKPRLMYDCYSIYTHQACYTLLIESMQGHIINHYHGIYKINSFIKRLDEAITFLKEFQSKSSNIKERKILDDVWNFNLKNNSQSFKFIDLREKNLLNILEQIRNENKDSMLSLVERVLTLNSMINEMKIQEDKAHNGNYPDREKEINTAEELLDHFNHNYLDGIQSSFHNGLNDKEYKKELENTLEVILNNDLKSEEEELDGLISPFYKMILNLIEKAKEDENI